MASPVEAVASVGLGREGTRGRPPLPRRRQRRPGEALTLVEGEVVDEVGLAPGGTRRQVTVRGVRLNELIGRRFRVGSVECYGVRLCEPCLTLEGNTRPGIIRELVHRAGINADILNDGTITVGDAITTTDD